MEALTRALINSQLSNDAAVQHSHGSGCKHLRKSESLSSKMNISEPQMHGVKQGSGFYDSRHISCAPSACLLPWFSFPLPRPWQKGLSDVQSSSPSSWAGRPQPMAGRGTCSLRAA